MILLDNFRGSGCLVYGCSQCGYNGTSSYDVGTTRTIACSTCCEPFRRCSRQPPYYYKPCCTCINQTYRKRRAGHFTSVQCLTCWGWTDNERLCHLKHLSCMCKIPKRIDLFDVNTIRAARPNGDTVFAIVNCPSSQE